MTSKDGPILNPFEHSFLVRNIHLNGFTCGVFLPDANCICLENIENKGRIRGSHLKY
jgi:hypothetical protein